MVGIRHLTAMVHRKTTIRHSKLPFRHECDFNSYTIVDDTGKIVAFLPSINAKSPHNLELILNGCNNYQKQKDALSFARDALSGLRSISEAIEMIDTLLTDEHLSGKA